jgi:hypothetical protein
MPNKERGFLMEGDRIFTQAELEEMGKRTRDLIDEAIDRGDLEKAKRLNHRMYAEFLAMHDLFRDWITGLLSYVYDNYGVEALDDSMKQAISSWFKPMVELYEKADFRTKVNMLAMGLRGHLQPMEITEDDEKVCIRMIPCGTGERLIKDGAYEPPKNFSTVTGSHALTWGRPECPVYCAHEPMLEILPIDWVGHPVWAVYPQEDRWGGCRFCVYKKVEDIPEVVYQRVGKEKPDSP